MNLQGHIGEPAGHSSEPASEIGDPVGDLGDESDLDDPVGDLGGPSDLSDPSDLGKFDDLGIDDQEKITDEDNAVIDKQIIDIEKEQAGDIGNSMELDENFSESQLKKNIIKV